MRKILYTILFIVITSGLAGAESEISPQGDNIIISGKEFFVDNATYKGANDEVFAEVYFGVSLGGLEHETTDDGNLYRFSLGTQIRDKETGEIISWDMAYKTVELPFADEREAPLSVGMLTLSAPTGLYDIEMGVGDLISGEASLYKKEIYFPDYYDGITISDIELSNVIAPSSETGEFLKNGYWVIPNPTRLVSDYPGETHIYFEIYNADSAPDETMLEYIIQLKNGKILLRNSEIFTNRTDIAKVKSFDLKGFPAGSYDIVISLVSNEETLAQSKKPFVIYHETTAEELAALKSKYLPFTKTEESEIRHYLSYLATEEELKAFDALSAEEKPIFVEYFWERHDPYPETEENEFRDEFFTRFDYVNQNFYTPFRNGADTDRGKIYLRFGEPDDIVREPGGLPSQIDYDSSTWQTKPFEVWEYFGAVEGQLVWFHFVDKNGDGSFRIETSSLPGYGSYSTLDSLKNSGGFEQ